jgi:hypothetical protein
MGYGNIQGRAKWWHGELEGGLLLKEVVDHGVRGDMLGKVQWGNGWRPPFRIV